VAPWGRHAARREARFQRSRAPTTCSRSGRWSGWRSEDRVPGEVSLRVRRHRSRR
jgi:hypothetical protein